MGKLNKMQDTLDRAHGAIIAPASENSTKCYFEKAF